MVTNDKIGVCHDFTTDKKNSDRDMLKVGNWDITREFEIQTQPCRHPLDPVSPNSDKNEISLYIITKDKMS